MNYPWALWPHMWPLCGCIHRRSAVIVYGLMLLTIISTVSGRRQGYYIAPSFRPTDNNVTTTVGSDVTLPCHVDNLGPKSVVWRKQNKKNAIAVGDYVFDPDKSYSIVRQDVMEDTSRQRFDNHRHHHTNPVWNLKVSNVKFSHQGVYECVISTKDYMLRNVTLTVVEDRSHQNKKKAGIELTGTNFTDKGSTIDLNCTATAMDYRPKGLDWFKDGARIKPGGRRLITDQYVGEENVVHSRLEIQRVTMDDMGIYVCRFSQTHVKSIRVMVLNTDTFKNRRDMHHTQRTGTEGLEMGNHRDEYYGSRRDSGHVSRGSCLISITLALVTLVWWS